MANPGNKRFKGDGKGRQGGRKKGTPNKTTRERRELIDEFLNENWDEFKDLYRSSDNVTKVRIFMELIPYTTPKMASVEYKDKDKPKTLQDELDEDSGLQSRE